ncbi:MAG: ComF family protein [Gammaproteobacteria bacterium]|nr:ComF family protein [Gammaproteobacteria bacterium]NND46256.1 ComF family protein [Woeseiaceae bacterium]NNL44555.1 ComF family protein [Woeseiaceae bacterium]
MDWPMILRVCLGRAADALRQLDDSIMPLRCVFCGTRSDRFEGRICSGCCRDLPWIANACARCAEPLAVCLPPGVYCAACQSRVSPIHATVAPLLYEFPVDAGLKALKFGRRLHYAPAFGELLAAEMPRLAADIDALLPVPLHWRRQAFRGFNQALELCRPLARNCDLPIMTGVARRRATPFQSGLAAVQRRQNLRKAFFVRKTHGFRHVLIVDDVVTTGETTRQLGIALIRRGVEKVSVLAVARAA